jgi:hypothetical protein
MAPQPARRLGRREPDIQIGVELGDDLGDVALPGAVGAGVVRPGQARAGASRPLPFWPVGVPATSATR